MFPKTCTLLGLEDISNSELYRGKKETRTSPLLPVSLKMRLITYMFSTCLCLWLFFSSIAYTPTLPHRDPVPEAVVQHVQRHFKWEVEYMFGIPDCVVGINGQFPGPTIRAKAGDTISVEVTNKLHTEGVVIHWHGITKLGTPTPWADGIASINPGETFLYRFKVNKAGIYVYHGHFGMQRSARLYGSLIIDVGDGEKGPFHYDGVHDQEVDLSSKPFRWTRGPRKLLIKDDKEIRRNMASVHGSISNPSGSESFSPDDQLP